MTPFGRTGSVSQHKLYLENRVLLFISVMSSTQVTSWNAQAGTVDAVSLAIRNLATDRKILEKAFAERPAVP